MDVKQIQYIMAIAEEKSISKAAEKLYITQSALNQQLLRLERELGLKLFDRVNHTMEPTYGGRVYLDAGQKMLDIKQNTYKTLSDISHNKIGEISITYTPERGALMFSSIYPEFHKIHPGISFKIHEARAKKMEELLLKRVVNLAFIAYTQMKPEFDYYPLKPELLVLGLPVSHPLAYLAGENSHRTLPPIDLYQLREERFTLMTHETLFRDMVDDVFAKAGFMPRILFESTSTSTIINMVKQQVCPAFFPQSYVDSRLPIVYFSTEPRVSWMHSAAAKKGSFLNKAELDLIRLAREYAVNDEGQ